MKCKEQGWQRVKDGGGCKNEVGDFETGAEEGTGTREPKERALFGQGKDLTHMDLITHLGSVRNRNKVLWANIGLARKLIQVRWKNSNKILAQPIVWLLFSVRSAHFAADGACGWLWPDWKCHVSSLS